MLTSSLSTNSITPTLHSLVQTNSKYIHNDSPGYHSFGFLCSFLSPKFIFIDTEKNNSNIKNIKMYVFRLFREITLYLFCFVFLKVDCSVWVVKKRGDATVL